MYLLIIGCFILVSLIMWFVFLPHEIHKKIETFQSELVDKHYEEVDNMYQTMRAWKHNYHNHIQTMEAFLELNRMEELKQYLLDMKADMASMEVILRTGNTKADAILNSKRKRILIFQFIFYSKCNHVFLGRMIVTEFGWNVIP